MDSAETNTAQGYQIEESPIVHSRVVPRTSLLKRVVLFGVLLWLVSAFGIVSTLYWIYGTDTRHDDLSSIWWPTAGTDLIPSTATDITLRQDHLDHDATYTVSRVDLQKFLKERLRTSANDSIYIGSVKCASSFPNDKINNAGEYSGRDGMF